MLTARGFTLVELLVALGLMGIVSTAIYRVLMSSQRAYQVETQRIDMHQNLRAAATILPVELRELDAADGDLVAMSRTSLTIRAPRQLAFLCAPPSIGASVAGSAGAVMTIRLDPFYGIRDFNTATDSIFVFYDGDPGTPRDDGWVRGRLGAELTPARCADGSPGRLLRATLVFETNQVALTGRISSGSPVRGFETVTYGGYRAADGQWYLGVHSSADGGGSARQPAIGPLSGATGVTFEYFAADGAATAVAAQVALIRVTVRARTALPVRQHGGPPAYVTDSIVTSVSLRNNRRWDTIAPGS